jgi:hypothetical protein
VIDMSSLHRLAETAEKQCPQPIFDFETLTNPSRCLAACQPKDNTGCADFSDAVRKILAKVPCTVNVGRGRA